MAGGALGAVLRYKVYLIYSKPADTPKVITSTVLVNVLGCFLAGVLMYLIHDGYIASERVITFLGIGLLGSLTTFSAFSLEALKLIQIDLKKGLIYLLVQFTAALTGVAAGFEITAFMMRVL